MGFLFPGMGKMVSGGSRRGASLGGNDEGDGKGAVGGV